MNFLSPLFLIGAALIIGPILAHLIRQATKTRVTFSAMRFLAPSPPKLDRRNRLEHPWLLLLRCLIIAALAFGFARPFLKQDLPIINSPTIPQSVVAVLDESATMQRAGLWNAATKKISDLVDSLGSNDQFVLLAASSGTTEIISHEKWKETAQPERANLVHAVLASRQPGWGQKNLDSAIETAAGEWEQMKESANAVTRMKMVVVSDFTYGARVSGLAGMKWPAGSEVKLENVAPTHEGDAGVQWLGWSDTKDGLILRVRVVQSAKSAATNLRLQLRDAKSNDAIGEPQKLTVQAGDSQIAALPVPADAADKPLRVDLEGDQENFDNTVWAVRPTPRAMSLIYYGGQPANDIKHARFYLERAVEGWKDPTVKVVSGEDTRGDAKAGSDFFVVAGPLNPLALEAVKIRLTMGDFALVLLNDPAMVDTAAQLAGEAGWTPQKPTEKNAMFGQIDFQNPLFSIFADPHYSDFTHVQFWQPQSLKLPDKTAATVVAKFDGGQPAVIEVPVGQGRLIIWGSDWSTSTGNWVLSTKFIPWLQGLFEREAGGALRPSIADVGDTTRLLGGEAAQWRPLASAEGSFVETAPTSPGVYQVRQGEATRWVALQVPASASNITVMPLEKWEKLGVPLHAQPLTSAASVTAPVGQNQTAPVLEARQKLWRWLLLGAAFLLAVESIYSLVLSRRNEHNPEVAA